MSVLRSQLIDAARRPTRMLLMGAAMIIAAFVVFGTVLASQITERTVLDGFSGTPAAVDFVVGDDESPVTARTLAAVRGVPGVAEAVARTSTAYGFANRDRQTITVNADPGSGPLATVRVVSGRYPAAANEIAVTARTVDRLGLSPGETVRITRLAYDKTGDGTDDAPAEQVTLTVVGVVDARDDFGDVAYTTDEFALRLDGSAALTRVELRLAPGADPDTVRAALQRATAGTAGTGTSGGTGSTGTAGTPDAGGTDAGATPAEQADPVISSGAEVRYAEAVKVSEHVRSLFGLIGMFVAIAVVAAALVATSTFRIVFAQRMRQLALLRAIGADRGGVLRALVVEGTLTGLVAGSIGVLAAAVVGHALPPLLRAAGPDIASPGYPIGWAVAVLLGTTLVTVLAVLAPAATAARVAPLEALRTASTAAGRRRIGGARAAIGILLGAGALVAGVAVARSLPDPDTQSYDASRTLLLLVLSGALAYGALVALGPLLVRPVLATVGWPLRRLGPVGRLAVGGVGGAPRRAAAVSVVVALGVTLIAGALVGSASLRALINRELAGMAPADIVVAGADGGSRALPDGLVTRARAANELGRVVSYRSDPEVGLAGTDTEGLPAVDLDLRELATWEDFGASAGTLDALGPGRVVLLRFLAEQAGVRPGELVSVIRGGRSVELRLVATLDNTPVSAGLLLDASDLDRLGTPANPTGLLADAADDGEAARTAAVNALRAIAGPTATVEVMADVRDEMNGELNLVIGVLLALLGLTVVVAVVGVGTTTALSVVERTRESGLLRAIGMSRWRLRTMLTVEAGLYGLIGATLGLLLAVPYSWLAVEALGANAPVEFPAGQLALVVLVLAAATALAGLLPARRAARVSPVAALGVDG